MMSLDMNKENDAMRCPRLRGRSSRSFGRILDNAVSELREEADLKCAMKQQLKEADDFIQKLSDDVRREIAGDIR